MQKHSRINLNKNKISFKGSPHFYAFQPSSMGSWEYHYKVGVFCLSRCKATKRKNYQPVSTWDTLYLLPPQKTFPQSVFHSHCFIVYTSQPYSGVLISMLAVRVEKKMLYFQKNYKESKILFKNQFYKYQSFINTWFLECIYIWNVDILYLNKFHF